MQKSRPTRPGTSWPISNGCGNLAGLASARLWRLLGLRRWPWPMPRPILSGLSELVVRGIYTLTKAELDWYYQFGVSEMFPDKWERFIAPIPPEERHEMMRAYHRRLTSEDRGDAACRGQGLELWEGETITLLPEPDTKHALRGGRIRSCVRPHRKPFLRQCRLAGRRALLRDAYKLHGIPGVIVHGRYDMPCPAKYAWQLHKAWPKPNSTSSRGRTCLFGAGHSRPAHPATDKFCRQDRIERVRRTRNRSVICTLESRHDQGTHLSLRYALSGRAADAGQSTFPSRIRSRLGAARSIRHGLCRGRYPGANPTDTEFFKCRRTDKASFVASA